MAALAASLPSLARTGRPALRIYCGNNLTKDSKRKRLEERLNEFVATLHQAAAKRKRNRPDPDVAKETNWRKPSNSMRRAIEIHEGAKCNENAFKTLIRAAVSPPTARP